MGTDNWKLPMHKVRHMHAVAELMYGKAPDYGLDPEQMYVLGLLHDIGRLRVKEGHAKASAKILEKCGLPNWACTAAGRHGASLKGLPYAPPPELLLLIAADLSTDSHGNYITCQERLEGISRFYGKGSAVYETARDNIEYLEQKGFLKNGSFA